MALVAEIFACVIYLPAAAALAVLAWSKRGSLPGVGLSGSARRHRCGVAYDLSRLPFVLNGAPLLKVFHRFGEMLLGAPEPRWLVQVMGWTFHFSRGRAGIMFCQPCSDRTCTPIFRRRLMALAVEVLLLLTPTPVFRNPARSPLVALTLTAHLFSGMRWASGALAGKVARDLTLCLPDLSLRRLVVVFFLPRGGAALLFTLAVIPAGTVLHSRLRQGFITSVSR